LRASLHPIQLAARVRCLPDKGDHNHPNCQMIDRIDRIDVRVW
jgi:hypothetical protein